MKTTSAEQVKKMPWQDRENLLLQHLNDKPYLFVLDGLERILLAYNRMDASSLADDEYDEQCQLRGRASRTAGLGSTVLHRPAPPAPNHRSPRRPLPSEAGAGAGRAGS